MICNECGKEINKKIYSGGICQGCYNYKRLGGVVHKLPALGMIEKDDKGYVICHICGRSYKRLGSHAKESHNLTIEQYKEKFGLCRNARTTEDKYSKVMKQHAYDNNMPAMLTEKGKRTRLTSTNKLHCKSKVRLQEIIDKRNRKKGV